MFDLMIAKIVIWNILENFLIMMWYYDCLLVVSYGWWKKSCTSWHGKYLIFYSGLYIQGG